LQKQSFYTFDMLDNTENLEIFAGIRGHHYLDDNPNAIRITHCELRDLCH